MNIFFLVFFVLKKQKWNPHKHISNDILCFSDSYHLKLLPNPLWTYCTLTKHVGNKWKMLTKLKSICLFCFNLHDFDVSLLSFIFLFYVSLNSIIILYQSIIVFFYLLDIHVTWKTCRWIRWMFKIDRYIYWIGCSSALFSLNETKAWWPFF